MIQPASAKGGQSQREVCLSPRLIWIKLASICMAWIGIRKCEMVRMVYFFPSNPTANVMVLMVKNMDCTVNRSYTLGKKTHKSQGLFIPKSPWLNQLAGTAAQMTSTLYHCVGRGTVKMTHPAILWQQSGIGSKGRLLHIVPDTRKLYKMPRLPTRKRKGRKPNARHNNVLTERIMLGCCLVVFYQVSWVLREVLMIKHQRQDDTMKIHVFRLCMA